MLKSGNHLVRGERIVLFHLHCAARLAAVVCVIVLASSCLAAEQPTAAANLVSCDEQPRFGFAWLRERPSEEGIKVVDLFVGINGLAPGKHAWHIHQTGSCQ